jgi:hypothetical protein
MKCQIGLDGDNTMPSGIVAICGLICGMISLRFMIAVEKAQVIVAGAIGQSLQADRIVAMAIGTRKLFAMKVAIAFFSRMSNLMFSLEGMYQEKAIQKAIASIMNTMVVSTRTKVAARHYRAKERRSVRTSG